MRHGVWAAPGRVNLIGEHTDYNDGFVMPFALERTVVAEASRRDDGVLRLHSAGAPGGPVELRVADLAPGHGPGGWSDYPAGVLWALREAGHRVGGADLRYESTLPAGAGLSSSAALEVVTALALSELYELGLPRQDIALLCQRAENRYAGAPTGIMDQTASACCTAGHALHLDTRDLTRRQIPLDLAAHGLTLLLVDTGVKHSHSQGTYGERRAGCERAARTLGLPALRDLSRSALPKALSRLPEDLRPLVRHVVTENHRVALARTALESGDPRSLGPLLTDSHTSLRDDFRVSCPELDLAVSTALATGALGARMTGGGFGGAAIALVETPAHPAVTAHLSHAFTEAGFHPPTISTASASRGAHRLS